MICFALQVVEKVIARIDNPEKVRRNIPFFFRGTFSANLASYLQNRCVALMQQRHLLNRFHRRPRMKGK